MSLRRYLVRVLADLADVPSIVVAFLLLYITNIVLLPSLLAPLLEAFATFLVKGSLLQSLYSFITTLVSSPVSMLSLLLILFFNVYLLSFLLIRLWQRRTGKATNPFKAALLRWIHVFVALGFVASIPFILLILYIVYQPYSVSQIIFYLFLLSMFLWVPFSFPSLAAAAVEEARGRDIVYEALLAGRLYGWKVLVAFLLISIFVWLLYNIPLPEVLIPYYNLVTGALMTVLMAAASVEAYYGFKKGE